MDAVRLVHARQRRRARISSDRSAARDAGPVACARGTRAPVAIAPGAIAAAALFVFGVALLLSAIAAYEMYQVLAVGGLTTLEAVILVLFVILFAWIALSFASTLGGVLR